MNPPQPILWIHGDNLNRHGPAFTAYPTAPALWVWDEALLRQWQISLKRIVFIYECLLDLPVVIRRGTLATELGRFAAEHETNQVVTAASPSPRFREIVTELEQRGLTVTILPERPFVKTDTQLDLKRAARYWRAVKQAALYPEKTP